jgi:hypothetical protein
LQDILKYSERANQDTTDLKRALEVMQVVPKAANDMMNVGRLQGFDVSYAKDYFCTIRDNKFYSMHGPSPRPVIGTAKMLCDNWLLLRFTKSA